MLVVYLCGYVKPRQDQLYLELMVNWTHAGFLFCFFFSEHVKPVSIYGIHKASSSNLEQFSALLGPLVGGAKIC